MSKYHKFVILNNFNSKIVSFHETLLEAIEELKIETKRYPECTHFVAELKYEGIYVKETIMKFNGREVP